jgi:hypothetical protein
LTKREAEDLISALDEYLDAKGGLFAVCDGPNDKRIVRHRKCRERLVSLLAPELPLISLT